MVVKEASLGICILLSAFVSVSCFGVWLLSIPISSLALCQYAGRGRTLGIAALDSLNAGWQPRECCYPGKNRGIGPFLLLHNAPGADILAKIS
jgi:hypothetical protein